MIFAIAALSVLFVAGYSIYVANWQHRTTDFDFMEISKITPIGECIYLQPENIVQQFQNRTGLYHVHHSALSHMEHDEELNSIGAYHLGQPYCYAALRKQVDGSVLGMFNMKIVGYSKSHVSSIPESSVACTNTVRYIKRSDYIVVEYVEIVQELNSYYYRLMEREFRDVDAYAVQNVWSYNKGLSICESAHYTKQDLGVDSLRHSAMSMACK